MGTLPRFLGITLGFWAALSSCGSSTANSMQSTTGYGGALATTAVAAGLWAVGHGCNMQGCPYGSYCDKKSGFCDTRKCTEGCPPNTTCNEGLDRCQDPAPASPPNDFLPEDNDTRRLTP